jgi:hypothetical protein
MVPPVNDFRGQDTDDLNGLTAQLRLHLWDIQTSGGGTNYFFFHERGLISIIAYWMTVIHIPFTQFNVTAIGLGYYMILNFPYTHHEVATT